MITPGRPAIFPGRAFGSVLAGFALALPASLGARVRSPTPPPSRLGPSPKATQGGKGNPAREDTTGREMALPRHATLGGRPERARMAAGAAGDRGGKRGKGERHTRG